MDVTDRIKNGEYTSKYPYLAKSHESRVAKLKDQARLNNQLKADLLADVGLTGHPKADLLFEKAWDLGHASGLQEVTTYFYDLAELLVP